MQYLEEAQTVHQNEDLNIVWQANCDIQYVLNAYSCVIYICVYMIKAQKGMSTLIAKACKEEKDSNMTLKQSVHHMANKFLNVVESPVMEVCYMMCHTCQ